MTTPEQLIRKLTHHHHQLLDQLETRYNNHISKLLDQKKQITMYMQQQFDSQIQCIHGLDKNINIALSLDCVSLISLLLMQTNSSQNCNITQFSPVEQSSKHTSELNEYHTNMQELNANPNETTYPLIGFRFNQNLVQKHFHASQVNIIENAVPNGGNKQKTQINGNNYKKIKKWKCEYCTYATDHKGSLKRHIRIHTGETPFKCSYCHKGFKGKGDLTKHLRVHTGEKPYKCKICGKRFRQNAHLKAHSRIHTCSKCKRLFNDISSLNRHHRNCLLDFLKVF
eukprot:514508_1